MDADVETGKVRRGSSSLTIDIRIPRPDNRWRFSHKYRTNVDIDIDRSCFQRGTPLFTERRSIPSFGPHEPHWVLAFRRVILVELKNTWAVGDHRLRFVIRARFFLESALGPRHPILSGPLSQPPRERVPRRQTGMDPCFVKAYRFGTFRVGAPTSGCPHFWSPPFRRILR